MLWLHTIQEIAEIYCEIAVVIVRQLRRMSGPVDFICDTYVSAAIKDFEHSRSGAS